MPSWSVCVGEASPRAIEATAGPCGCDACIRIGRPGGEGFALLLRPSGRGPVFWPLDHIEVMVRTELGGDGSSGKGVVGRGLSP